MQKNMRCLCFWLCLWLCLSFKWPDGNVLLTEFAGTDSILQHPEPASYIVFEGGEFTPPNGGELLFQGRLPNSLGYVQLFHDGNGMMYIYGDPSEGGDVAGTIVPEEPGQRILMVLDGLKHRVINPEIVLNNPGNNKAPALVSLNFFRTAQRSQQVAVLYPWNVNRARDFEAGEYYLSIEYTDGRFATADVRQLYSVLLYVNEELKYRQGIMYFQENQGALELFPGFSGDSNAISVLFEPGENNIKIYLQDPKGLSSSYEFIINGEVIRAEPEQL